MVALLGLVLAGRHPARNAGTGHSAYGTVHDLPGSASAGPHRVPPSLGPDPPVDAGPEVEELLEVPLPLGGDHPEADQLDGEHAAIPVKRKAWGARE